MSGKFLHAVREETLQFHFRPLLAQSMARRLPRFTFNRVRTQILRLGGLRIGEGSLVMGELFVTGLADARESLTVGQECVLVGPLHIDLGAAVRIGDRVTIGPHTVILTVNHQTDANRNRGGVLEPLPVTIGTGSWIAARATILPGVTIGEGAVVAAGAVVTRDVPPNTLAGGVPARVLREL